MFNYKFHSAIAIVQNVDCLRRRVFFGGSRFFCAECLISAMTTDFMCS